MKKKGFLTSHYDQPEQSAGFLLWQLYNQWHRLQTTALKKLGLTHVQFVLLARTCWMEQQSDEVTQIALATAVSTDPMMTSQVLRTLQKKRYITRKINKQDQRSLLLASTPQGKRLLKKALVAVERVDDDFFAVLGNKHTDFMRLVKKLLHD